MVWIFEAVDAYSLNDSEKKNDIALLMFLTERRNGTIKARAFADGRKQRKFTDKHDAMLPTAMLESIFITTAICKRTA